MLHKPLSLESSQREGSGSEGPVTYLGHTAGEWPQPLLPGAELAPKTLGAVGPQGHPWGSPTLQWQEEARTPPRLHWKVLMGLGNPRVSPPLPPQPQAFHVLWPPFCLVSTAIFIPCSFQPAALVCEGGRAGNGTASRGVGGATGVAEGPRCPSKGRLPPALCREAQQKCTVRKPQESPDPTLFLNWFVKAGASPSSTPIGARRAWPSLDTGVMTYLGDSEPGALPRAPVYYINNTWQLPSPLCASVSSSAKWNNNNRIMSGLHELIACEVPSVVLGKYISVN